MLCTHKKKLAARSRILRQALREIWLACLGHLGLKSVNYHYMRTKHHVPRKSADWRLFHLPTPALFECCFAFAAIAVPGVGWPQQGRFYICIQVGAGTFGSLRAMLGLMDSRHGVEDWRMRVFLAHGCLIKNIPSIMLVRVILKIGIVLRNSLHPQLCRL